LRPLATSYRSSSEGLMRFLWHFYDVASYSSAPGRERSSLGTVACTRASRHSFKGSDYIPEWRSCAVKIYEHCRGSDIRQWYTTVIYEHCRGPKAARARAAAPAARRACAAVPVAPNARTPLSLSVASTEKREQDTKRLGRDIKRARH